ncbi:sigma-70 family RNA polymerase sigma factor [Heyndrickxia sp. MSNUG]|uniref:sigma-70 family RNA polymerase sigma factor n=1 Tax=Heyndrickxia sp. MSNUG TaxID=3136677 RepID=UPI003C2BD743
MNWESATEKQLWMIIADDWHVPEHLLEGLAVEALNRNLFDHLIKHLINKKFDRWDHERIYNFYDLYQIGYIGIVKAIKNYKPGKGSFKTFCYMNIKSEFSHHIEKVNSEKRKVYEDLVSIDKNRHEDVDETFLDYLIDETQNPEKVTINKLTWSENFGKLSETEKEVVELFSEGYSFNEIARLKGYSGAAFISRLFHRGAEKMNPHYVKQSLKDMGLMTRTKGA